MLYVWTAQGKVLVGRSDQVVEEFGISRQTLYRWQRDGMPVVRIGRSVLFPIAAVRKWVTQNHGGEAHYGRRSYPARK